MLPAASVPADFYIWTLYAVFCIALSGISDLYVNVHICNMTFRLLPVIIIYIIMYLWDPIW